MPSALYSVRNCFLPLAFGRQQVHQRVRSHPGSSHNIRTAASQISSPAPDRDRTVSRRSDSSCTRLMERTAQPLGLLPPQMRSDIEVPTLRRCELWDDKPVIPRVAFIRLSDGNPTFMHAITKGLLFVPSSTFGGRVQAPSAFALRMFAPF